MSERGIEHTTGLCESPGLSEGSPLYTTQNDVYERFSDAEDAPGKITDVLRTVTRNKTILDIGCGTGKYAAIFACSARQYIGIDRSAEQLALARRRNTHRQSVTFIQSCAQQLPVRNNSIETAIATWAIGSVDREWRARALSETQRTLKTGGAIYIVENSPRSEFQSIRGRDYEARAARYNKWLESQGYAPINTIETYFEFRSAKEASDIFQRIWGTEIRRIDSNRIEHTVIVFRKEVHGA
jgi:ubiquinone/menaquinone biosynthesis C-methylase UbiE